MCLSVQAPVFISFFIALRKMAYLPVPSFQTGGLLWFPDLTAADPFYLLPLAVTGTMFFILEVRDFSLKQWTDFSLWQTVRCIHVFSECLPLFSWVQSLVLTIPTCELWRLCSGSCLLSSSLSRSTSPRSVCCSFSSLYSLVLTTRWNTLTRNILNWLHSLAHLLSFYPQTNFRLCSPTGSPPTAFHWVKWLCSDTRWSETGWGSQRESNTHPRSCLKMKVSSKAWRRVSIHTGIQY